MVTILSSFSANCESYLTVLSKISVHDYRYLSGQDVALGKVTIQTLKAFSLSALMKIVDNFFFFFFDNMKIIDN